MAAMMVAAVASCAWAQAGLTAATIKQAQQNAAGSGLPALAQSGHEQQAQTKPAQQPSAKPPATVSQKKKRPPPQTKRMFWIVPNFAAVSAGTQFKPLTTKGKFLMATDDSFDYSSFAWTAVVAAQSFGLNSDPELGGGIAGYGRYYWRAFVDGVSGTYFTEAIVPALTHEDPRYFTRGEGGFFRRIGYALSRTFVTRTDSGGSSFNWSEAGGNALEATLSNAYYPPQERGVSQTARNWATQMESAALNNVAKEFWPDIRSGILHVIKIK
ncbi:MAG TPA: hypothetical protein VKS20_10250 [Candidatus Acidoferrales bacterium]|nr:hypothetical protein [Candidatus Acidoferrales bacterium]